MEFNTEILNRLAFKKIIDKEKISVIEGEISEKNANLLDFLIKNDLCSENE